MTPVHQFERGVYIMNRIGFNPKFTITNRITVGFTRIDRTRGFFEATTLSENWVREMGNRSLVLEAYRDLLAEYKADVTANEIAESAGERIE